MGHIQIALQRIAAVFLQQRCNMRPVLGRFAALQKIRQIRIAERPLRSVPDIFLCSGFHVFVLLAMKRKPDSILVQQEIAHPKAPFGQKMLLYPYYSMDILLAKVVLVRKAFCSGQMYGHVLTGCNKKSPDRMVWRHLSW